MTDSRTETFERRSLLLSMAGNVILGLAGVATAYLSNSQAILVDGLFSLVGFLAALVAIRVTRQATQGPNKIRPLGYAMDEAIFTMFRSFFLLGLVIYSGTGAVLRILAFMHGDVPAPLNFAPIGIYMVVVLAISALLWLAHHTAWVKGGRRSDVLRVEADAAAFNGLMTVGAGVGFGLVFLLKDSSLGVITPIGDSLVVLVLCFVAVFDFYRNFRGGLEQVAGVSADPDTVLKAGRIVRSVLSDWPGQVIDLAVLRAGRTTSVVAYLDPSEPMDAAGTDALTDQIRRPLNSALGRTEVMVVLTRRGRSVLVPEQDRE